MNESTSTNDASDSRGTTRGEGALQIETRWLKPVVAQGGGEAVLLVCIIAPSSTPNERQAPLDVAFVVDRSGSMAGGKLELAKTGVDLAVSRLRDEDRVALVVYDDSVDTIQALQSATPRAKSTLRLALHSVDPGGSTNLAGGWMAGCGELANAQSTDENIGTRIRRTILLTDGLANVGITDPQQLSHHAGALRRRGIATTTIGVGQNFDEGLLSALAEAGGGNFQYAENANAMREFFSQELQSLLSVVATGLTVTLQAPESITAELLSAFPVDSGDDGLRIAIGDLVAGDEINLVFSLPVGKSNGATLSPISVMAGWTDPRADLLHQHDVSPELLRYADQSICEGTAGDLLVEEQVALQRAAAERRAGLEMDRRGRYEESRAHLMRSRQVLSAAPSTDRVREQIREGDFLIPAPVSSALGSHTRKLAQHREDLRRRGRSQPVSNGEDSDR